MPIASPDDAERAARTWPGTTEADLQKGRELYIARCSGCHQPVLPSHVAPTDWPTHLQLMGTRAHLDEAQMKLVERYLVTMAAAASPPAMSKAAPPTR